MEYMKLLFVLLFGITYTESYHVNFDIFKEILPPPKQWDRIQRILNPICIEHKLSDKPIQETLFEIAQLGGHISPSRNPDNQQKIKNRIKRSIDAAFEGSKMKPYGKDYFFDHVIPFTACLTLKVPEYFPKGVPILMPYGRNVLSLTKAHVAVLLSAGYWGAIIDNGDLSPIYMLDFETRQHFIPKEINHSKLRKDYAYLKERLPSVRFNVFNFYGSFIHEEEKYKSFIAYLCTITELLSPHYPFYHENMKRLTDNKLLYISQNGGDKVLPPYERIDYQLNHSAAHDDTDWSASEKPLLPIVLNNRRIEDIQDAIHVDFADPYIGGIYFRYGDLQEEIYFATHPETIVSMLFTPKLADDQALVIAGAELYAQHKGYAKTFSFEGCASFCWNYTCRAERRPTQSVLDQVTSGKRVPIDVTGRRDIFLTAIDALPFSYHGKKNQYDEPLFHRELEKVYQGVKELPYYLRENLSVSSGNWGGGVFGGNISLKAMIQWIVASHTRRTLIYAPFREAVVKDIDEASKDLIAKYKTVGNLYNALVKILKKHKSTASLSFNFIEELSKYKKKASIRP